MQSLIEVLEISKSFGGVRAVDGLSFAVTRGEVLGFLGPNGAGKTTTMRMIAGFLEPTSGTARIDGVDVRNQPLVAKSRIGYLPEGAPLYGDMTVRDFIDFVASIHGLKGADGRQRIDAVIAGLALGDVLHQRIDTLSKGFKRRVGIAQAIVHNPPVLILDEPTDGLDPNQKREMRTLISDMAANKAIIISTHLLEEVDALCSRILIVDRGRIKVDATPKALRAQSGGTLEQAFRELTGADRVMAP